MIVELYLESVAEVDDEGGVIGTHADPLAVLADLQAADVVLVENGQHLGVRVGWNAEYFGRVRTRRVVVHARIANGVRCFQFGVRVPLQPQPLRQAFHNQPCQPSHSREVACQIRSALSNELLNRSVP